MEKNDPKLERGRNEKPGDKRLATAVKTGIWQMPKWTGMILRRQP